MKYQINHSNGITRLVDDSVINNDLSISMIGQNYKNYSNIFLDSFGKIVNNFANNSSPDNPIVGQFWYNSKDQYLNYYNGNDWKELQPPKIDMSQYVKTSNDAMLVPLTLLDEPNNKDGNVASTRGFVDSKKFKFKEEKNDIVSFVRFDNDYAILNTLIKLNPQTTSSSVSKYTKDYDDVLSKKNKLLVDINILTKQIIESQQKVDYIIANPEYIYTPKDAAITAKNKLSSDLDAFVEEYEKISSSPRYEASDVVELKKLLSDFMAAKLYEPLVNEIITDSSNKLYAASLLYQISSYAPIIINRLNINESNAISKISTFNRGVAELRKIENYIKELDTTELDAAKKILDDYNSKKIATQTEYAATLLLLDAVKKLLDDEIAKSVSVSSVEFPYSMKDLNYSITLTKNSTVVSDSVDVDSIPSVISAKNDVADKQTLVDAAKLKADAEALLGETTTYIPKALVSEAKEKITPLLNDFIIEYDKLSDMPLYSIANLNKVKDLVAEFQALTITSYNPWYADETLPIITDKNNPNYPGSLMFQIMGIMLVDINQNTFLPIETKEASDALIKFTNNLQIIRRIVNYDVVVAKPTIEKDNYEKLLKELDDLKNVLSDLIKSFVVVEGGTATYINSYKKTVNGFKVIANGTVESVGCIIMGYMTNSKIELPKSSKVVVIQIANENAAKDDNFEIILNDDKIGTADLSKNEKIGSLFIASNDTTISVSSGDFSVPIENMVKYYFDPDLLKVGENKISMKNIQNNNNGNAGILGIRSYILDPDKTLHTPTKIADLAYSGASGVDFDFTFNYDPNVGDV
jgi:hypothetical protein